MSIFQEYCSSKFSSGGGQSFADLCIIKSIHLVNMYLIPSVCGDVVLETADKKQSEFQPSEMRQVTVIQCIKNYNKFILKGIVKG